MSETINRVVRYLGPLDDSSTIEASGDRLDVTIRDEHFTLRTTIDLEEAERLRDALGRGLDRITGKDDG